MVLKPAPVIVDTPTSARRARDHRIDWLRGVALVSIFINHMPGNRFENWTTRNFGFSDAAELFVLLAGVAAALAYFPRFARGERLLIGVKALRRAGVLYGAHLLSTLAAVAIFGGAAWLFDNGDLFELIGISPILVDPVRGALAVALGEQQLGYFNILPLYVFLTLLLPGYLWLAARDVRLMLAAALAVYLQAQLLPVELHNFPADGGWYFNPFAWQLVYAIGMALGIMRLRGQTVPWHPAAGLLAGLYVVYAGVWMVGDMGGRVSFDLLPMWMDTLHKSMLPASRLLHLLALAYLLVNSPLWSRMARIPADNVLTRLGRNSLPVFVLGSLLSMVGYLTLVNTGSMLWLELALTAGSVGLMWALAFAIETGVFRRLRGAVVLRVRSWVDHATMAAKTPTARH